MKYGQSFVIGGEALGVRQFAAAFYSFNRSPRSEIKQGASKLAHSKAPFGRVLSSLFFILLWAVMPVMAQTKQAADKIREIEDSLIAPCCWSQPVSQHDSEIAQQIRNEVSSMVAAGKSRDDILDFYIAKYGERILVTPRAKGFNVLAYVLPWAALPLGAWALILLLRKLRSPVPAPAPSPAPAPGSRYDSVIEKELKEFEEE